MTDRELMIKIRENKDFINSPKYKNSLSNFLEEHPDGASDSIICKALCLSHRELNDIYNSVIQKLQAGMGIDE